MRQLMSWRTWAAIGALLVLATVVQLITGRGPRGGDDTGVQPTERRVTAIASVMAIQQSEAFAVIDGLTVGSATISLDDGRLVSLTRDTPGEVDCADRATPAACVFLADMLGEGVVWYALINADAPTSRTVALPTLVDMTDGGDTGVLANGWFVPLANGVVRTCAGEPRSPTLRTFIESFTDRGIRTVLDLDRDEVVEVICEN
ncbi:MAG: hypothetical protein RLZZ518_12 [Actinomycetota bacterium]|jgi:hypothetical protein